MLIINRHLEQDLAWMSLFQKRSSVYLCINIHLSRIYPTINPKNILGNKYINTSFNLLLYYWHLFQFIFHDLLRHLMKDILKGFLKNKLKDRRKVWSIPICKLGLFIQQKPKHGTLERFCMNFCETKWWEIKILCKVEPLLALSSYKSSPALWQCERKKSSMNFSV